MPGYLCTIYKFSEAIVQSIVSESDLVPNLARTLSFFYSPYSVEAGLTIAPIIARPDFLPGTP